MSMKNKITISLFAGIILLSGCSQKDQIIPTTISQKTRSEIHKEIPQWVHSNTNPYIATGSAPYRGQDYSFQRDEAIMVAKANLAESLEQKVDSLKKIHKSSSSANDQNFKIEITSKQVASKLMVGTYLTQTFVDNNNEMYVQIILDPKFALNIGEKLYLVNDLKADKAFKELESEVGKLDKWKTNQNQNQE